MKKRKKSSGLLILICVFVIIIAAGGTAVGYIYFTREQLPTAEEIFNQYVTLLQEGNYDGIYELIHDDVKQTLSKEDFLTRNQNIYNGIEAENFQVSLLESKEKEDGWQIIYEQTMDTIAGTLSFKYTMSLSENTDKLYQINWDSTLIFPELTNQDKVRIYDLESSRGTIYDRDSNALAKDGTASSVGIVPGKLAETKEADITKLAELLEMSADTVNNMLNASYVEDDMFIHIRTISKDNVTLQTQLLEISGVMLTDISSREYPYGEQTAHITGYVQAISAEELEEVADTGYYDENSIIGKTGLEKLYEERLRGVDGVEIAILDEAGDRKTTLATVPAQNGEDITLTIDIAMQSLLYEQLSGDSGCAAVMNPLTGEVLALVSTPSYNPNYFVNGILNSQWEALNSSGDQPLYTRFAGTWVPGSVFKPLTAAIGVEAGTIDPEEVTESNGLSWQKDTSWGSFFVTTLASYGDVTLEKALVNSDNIYFAKAALAMGSEVLSAGLDKMGFGESLPFSIQLSASTYESSGSITDELLLANSGYGQGEVLMNPLHLASVYSAFVNQGNMVSPYLEKTEDSALSYWKESVFSSETANTVLNSLIQVIEVGTGSEAKIAGVTLAGKTGTAEIKASQDDTEGTELGWFIAMNAEESEKPLLIVMMVEDVGERGGSHYVIPKVKAGFELYQQ